MSIGNEAAVFLAYAGGMILVIFLGKLLWLPVRYTIGFAVNCVIGGAVLLVISSLGQAAGIIMPVNIVTAAVSGFMGVPGIISLLIYFNAGAVL